MEIEQDTALRKEFSSMETREDVAKILKIEDKSLRYFLYHIRPENMYHSFEIFKKNGELRRISAPNAQLKQIQKKLAAVLTTVYNPKICAYGFVTNKSIVDNATQHTRRNLILNIDLKDFFTQIHFGRVQGMLKKPPYSIGEKAATTISQIACYNGVLPQGAPTSPILSNMICVPLDNSLMRLAKKHGCTYTRYADDITFSTSKHSFDESLVYVQNSKVVLGKQLLSILEKHSFQVNPDKITLKSRFNRQEVTGLTVNSFPNLKRSYIKNLRAILHHCEKYGVYQTAQEYYSKGFCKNKPTIKEIIHDPDKQETVELWFQNVLKGKVDYIRQIKGNNSLTYLSFAQKLNTLFDSELFDIACLDYLDMVAYENTFVLEYEDDDECVQGSGFYVPDYGIFTNFHVTENGAFFNVYTYKSYKKEPLGKIGKTLNEISSDKEIDYALYNPSFNINSNHLLKIGDSTNLKLRDRVTIIGYPEYTSNSTPYIQCCEITSKKSFFGEIFYTISGRVAHGASGGVVLNDNYEVVGIIKGGIITLSDDDNNINQGFIPIHLVINHL